MGGNRLPADMLIARDGNRYVIALRDARTAPHRVDRAEALGLVGHEESVLALDHDLAGGALGNAITGVPDASASSIAIPNGSRQRTGIRNPRRSRTPPSPCSADFADVANSLPVEIRLDLLAEVAVLAGLHRSGEHQGAARQPGGPDRDLRPFDRVHAPDSQQIVLLLRAQLPVVNDDRVGYDTGDPHTDRSTRASERLIATIVALCPSG